MTFEMKNIRFARAYGPDDKILPIKGSKGTVLPEVAIIGRSNVGKSSLINHFFSNKTLAKVSSQPGKTQTVNIFLADDDLVFVDLPGYGFAKVPKELRAKWGPMIEGYLKNRESLAIVLFLFDLRRDPSEEDISMLRWLLHFGKDVIIVFTKSDKLPRASHKKTAEGILNSLNIEAPYVIFSTKEGPCKETLKMLIIEKLNHLQGS